MTTQNFSMTFKEVKTWAANHGYRCSKENDGYCWYLITNESIKGVSESVSKLARDIYNNITSDQFIEHQLNYIKDINYE